MTMETKQEERDPEPASDEGKNEEQVVEDKAKESNDVMAAFMSMANNKEEEKEQESEPVSI